MTADRATLLALAEEVEQLTGPSREVDGRIWLAANPDVDAYFKGMDTSRAQYGAPAYTGSRDAAAELMPEGWWVTASLPSSGPKCGLVEAQKGGGELYAFCDVPSTEAIMRTACALRARAAEMEGENAEAV